jgi:hypothetical protein
MEKVNYKIVGCPLSQSQYEGMLRRCIQEYGREMSEGGVLRMALIYFHRQSQARGLLHILSEVLEAEGSEAAQSG